MESCDKCNTKVYERNLELVGDRLICPSCVGDAQEKEIPTSTPKHTYIKGTSTQQTGGGCMVDFVELKNGNVIGISDDCVVLYKNKHWWEGATESKALYFDEIGD